ncbi:MAG: hypothetical protein QM704_24405 [Anaeromyxobacteraceae bacterium]
MNALSRLALAASLSLAACSPSDSGSGAQTPEFTCPILAGPAAPGGIPNPTFAAHILPAMQSSCGSKSTTCHGPPSGGVLPKGKIEWATHAGRTADDVYDDIVDVAPSGSPPGYLLIKPFDTSKSWIYFKVTNEPADEASYGGRMPTGTSPLCPATIDTLGAWIEQGAPR